MGALEASARLDAAWGAEEEPDQTSLLEFAARRDARLFWGQWGTDGADLVEVNRVVVVGHRDDARRDRAAWLYPIRRDIVVQSLYDRISADGCPCKRRLRLMPCQRALQGHSARVLRLP